MVTDENKNEDDKNSESEEDSNHNKRTLYDAVFGKEDGAKGTTVGSVVLSEIDPKGKKGIDLINACLKRLGLPPASLKQTSGKSKPNHNKQR